MPKRKKSDLPVIKKGANGDFFCYYGGKKVYLAREEEKAKEKLLEILHADIGQGEVQRKKVAAGPAPKAAAEVKVQEVLLDFLKENEGHRDFSKMKRAARAVYEMYGDLEAADFGQVAFEAVRKKFIAENLSWSYINDLMGYIKTAFRLGVENRKVPENVFFFLQIIKPLHRGQAKTLPPRLDVADEDIIRTLDYLAPTVRDMVLLQRISGMRPSEMFKLRACDIDMSADVWVYSPVGKTARFGIQRNIAFGRFEQEILRRRMEKKGKTEPLFAPIDAVRDRYGENVQIDQRRTRQLREVYSKDSYLRAIRRAIDRGNRDLETRGVKDRINHWTPYQLRHASATFLSLYMGRDAAATLLGHTSTRTTRGYDHSEKQKVMEVVRKRDAMFGEQIKGLIGED